MTYHFDCFFQSPIKSYCYISMTLDKALCYTAIDWSIVKVRKIAILSLAFIGRCRGKLLGMQMQTCICLQQMQVCMVFRTLQKFKKSGQFRLHLVESLKLRNRFFPPVFKLTKCNCYLFPLALYFSLYIINEAQLSVCKLLNS